MPGSLQIWILGATAEVERLEQGIEIPDQARNLDRNQGNILLDPQWRMWLIDHTRAFVRDRRLPAPEAVQRVEGRFWERLHTLSDAELEAAVEA